MDCHLPAWVQVEPDALLALIHPELQGLLAQSPRLWLSPIGKEPLLPLGAGPQGHVHSYAPVGLSVCTGLHPWVRQSNGGLRAPAGLFPPIVRGGFSIYSVESSCNTISGHFLRG